MPLYQSICLMLLAIQISQSLEIPSSLGPIDLEAMVRESTDLSDVVYLAKSHHKHGGNSRSRADKRREWSRKEKSDGNDFDSYVLATEWAGSVCSLKNCDFNTGVDNFWNMHGLWPNKDDGRHPFECASTKLNLRSLPNSLKEDLNSYWAGLFASQSKFLDHEWSKHGTCWQPDSGDLAKMPRELLPLVEASRKDTTRKGGLIQPADYLSVALELGHLYNVFEALKESSIIPRDDKPYPLSEIRAAISAKFNGLSDYNLQCQKDENGRSMIKEIRICIDKNYNAMDCKRAFSTTCAKEIYYPINHRD